ncbi:MAG: hypothetical protein GY786_20410 [Proteobacteria bacterium]|nr:hypothetical protein [Pseudomonadota bacterium]
MFEYSCSDIRLVNWITQQNSEDPGALFPIQKGWNLYMNLYYITSGGQGVFLISLVNREEAITFLTIDKLVERSVMGEIKQEKVIKFVKENLKLKGKRPQLIFLGSEKLKKTIVSSLNNELVKCPVLILNAHSIEFIRGSFQNSRVEFRFSRLTFNAELLSDSIPAPLWHFDEGFAKSSIFQHLFHHLSKYWMKNDNKIMLNHLLDESIPYWENYAKKDRREMMNRVYYQLKDLVPIFFEEIFEIAGGQEAALDLNGAFIKIKVEPQIRKNQLLWVKRNNQAIDWLRNNTSQISVD